jgi:hypothetical protein
MKKVFITDKLVPETTSDCGEIIASDNDNSKCCRKCVYNTGAKWWECPTKERGKLIEA